MFECYEQLGDGTIIRIRLLPNLWHDLRRYGWRTALYNVRYLLRDCWLEWRWRRW